MVTTGGQWVELFSGARIAGYFWQNNIIVSEGETPPGCTFRQQPDGITTFWRGVGAYSPEGWPIDRVPSAGAALQVPGPIKGVNRSAIAQAAAFYVVCQVRLALDDPNGPDDRSRARYLVRVGCDLYAARSDGWFWYDTGSGGGRYDYLGYPRQTADFGGGRNRVLASTEWTTIGFVTMRPQGFNPGLAPPWASGWPENPYGKSPYGLTEAQIRANPPPLPTHWTATTSSAGLANSDYSSSQTYLLSQSGADRVAQTIFDRMVASTILAGYVIDSSGGTAPVLAAGASRSPRYVDQKVQPGNTLYTYADAEAAAAQAPAWQTTFLPDAAIGVAYSTAVAATGSPTYSKVSGPSWLSINSSTGAITGTPNDAEPIAYTVVLRATNATGAVDVSLSLRVVEAVSITSTTLAQPQVGVPYLATIEVDGTGPFAWSLTSGEAALTAIGLSLGGGVVFGAAPIAGSASITVRATNPSGQYDEQAYTITVVAAGSAPTITTTSLATGTVGTAYSAHVEAGGAPPFAFTVIAGALAAGLSLSHEVDYDIDISGATVRDAMADPLRLGYYPHNLLANSRNAVVENPLTNFTDNGLVTGVALPPDALATSAIRSVTVSNGSLVRFAAAISSVIGEQYAGGVWIRCASGTVTVVLDVCDHHPVTITVTTTWQFFSEHTLNNAYTYVGFLDLQPTTAGTLYLCEPRVHRGLKGLAYHETTGTHLDASLSWLLDPASEYKAHNLIRGSERLVIGENGWTKGTNITANGESGTLGGYPAYSFTSTAASQSFVRNATTTTLFPGETITVSYYCDTNVGTSWVDVGGTQFAVIDKTLVEPGVYLWRFRVTMPPGGYTMTIHAGVIDAPNGTTWRATRVLINRGLVVGTYVATTTAPTSGHIANAARGTRLRCSARTSMAWQLRADGSYEPGAHNLCPGSAVITTQNGWTIGPNITQNGCQGILNGVPAYSFTSTFAGNSYVLRNVPVSPGQKVAMRWYTNTALGATFCRFNPAGRQVNVTRTLISTGVYECTLTDTVALTNETELQFFVGAIDAPNGTTWLTSAPQVCNDAITAYVPTGAAAVFAPAVRWAANDGGAYEVQSEEPRTNNIRNSSAVLGAGLPTYWGTDSSTTGLTWSHVGRSTLLGMPAVDIRINGTAAASNYCALYFEAQNWIAAATGQTRTASFFVQRVAGSNNGITSFAAGMNENTGAGTYVTGGSSNGTVDTTARRLAYTRTFSGGGTIGACLPYLIMQVTSGQAVDITLRIACPQEELGASASTPMLGYGSITTRGDDIPVVEGLPDTSAGTMLVEFTPTLAPGIFLQNAVTLDDGTSSNRVVMARQTDRTGRCDLVTGGVSQGPAVTTSTTAAEGALSRLALGWSANDAKQSMNGSAIQTDTANTVPVTNRMVLGNQSVGLRALGGGVRRVRLRAWSSPAGNVVAIGNNLPPTVGDRALISGTPTVASSQTVLLSAANDVGSDDQALTLIINPPAASGTGGGWSKWLVR